MGKEGNGMTKRLMVLALLLGLTVGCTKGQVGQGEGSKTMKVDTTGLTPDQEKIAGDMMKDIVPLIKAGKSPSEVITALQELDAKKITRYPVEIGTSPTLGPANARVTIVEFTDFQCPFCSRVQPTLKQILEKYPQDVRKVFKHTPLAFHQDAPLAAEASLAAGAQGKFWEMKDILFNNQKSLKEEDLIRYAQELGLNLEQFKSDLTSRKYKEQVERDSKEAAALGVTGTPSFFVNGRYLSGAKPLEAFVQVIDEELSGKEIPFKWGKNVKEEAGKAGAKKDQPAEDPNKIYTVPTGTSPSKGAQSAPVTLVMFQDFQCPYSQRSQATIQQIMDAYPGKIKAVFKNFPLPFHKQAPLAAEAALAAGAQGKFWEMHDKIFANQQQMDIANFKQYAQDLKLDVKKFSADLDTHRFKAAVDEDMKTGTSVAVRGTPTFFVNGKKLVGAKPLAEFQKVIDPLLAK
jgi:protein-disulfide isomerase